MIISLTIRFDKPSSAETQLILRFKLWFKSINNKANSDIFIYLKYVKLAL